MEKKKIDKNISIKSLDGEIYLKELDTWSRKMDEKFKQQTRNDVHKLITILIPMALVTISAVIKSPIMIALSGVTTIATAIYVRVKDDAKERRYEQDCRDELLLSLSKVSQGTDEEYTVKENSVISLPMGPSRTSSKNDVKAELVNHKSKLLSIRANQAWVNTVEQIYRDIDAYKRYHKIVFSVTENEEDVVYRHLKVLTDHRNATKKELSYYSILDVVIRQSFAQIITAKRKELLFSDLLQAIDILTTFEEIGIGKKMVAICQKEILETLNQQAKVIPFRKK